MTTDQLPLSRAPHTSAWAAFFSLTGGSIFYCLSAMSVLYGISRLLGPHFASSEAIWAALPCLGALQGYELALLGVLFFIVVLRRVTDDAISLVVIMALFMIGGGLALTTVSLGSPRPAIVFGLLGFGLTIVKLETLRRFIGLRFTSMMLAALLIVLLWNGTIGGLTSLKASTINISKTYWLVSWIMPMLAALFFIVGSARVLPINTPHPLEDTPLLRRTPLALIFALIVFAASACHQYMMAYIFDVPQYLCDYLPMITLGAILLALLCFSLSGHHTFRDAVIALIPAAAMGLAYATEQLRTAAAWDISLVWYPPILLALTATGFFFMGLKRKARGLLIASGIYAFGVLLTFGYQPELPMHLNWRASGALAVVCMYIAGWRERNPHYCFVGSFLLMLGITTNTACVETAEMLGLSQPGLVFATLGTANLITGLFFGRDYRDTYTFISSLCLLIAATDILVEGSGHHWVLAMLVVHIAGVWLRNRNLPSMVLLALPLVFRTWALLSMMREWIWVILSFVLLFVGAMVSSLKSRESDPS